MAKNSRVEKQPGTNPGKLSAAEARQQTGGVPADALAFELGVAAAYWVSS